MILLFLLCVSSTICYQSDPFDSFAISSNKIYNANHMDSDNFEVITELGIFPDGIILKASDPIRLIKLNTEGVEIVRTDLGGYENNWEGNRIYWDSNNFVVPVAGGIQQHYSKDLTLNASFGIAGKASFSEVTVSGSSYAVQFVSVTKNENYYYALGYYNPTNEFATIQPVIVRFKLDGSIDNSFNASNTPGYTVIETSEPVLQPTEILVLENHIIVKTYNGYIVSISLDSPSDSYNVLSSVNAACNMAAASDNNSFFIFGYNKLYKYMGDLNPDLSFNRTGSVMFNDTSTLFPHGNLVFAIKRIGSRILLGGQYAESDSHLFPFILCYDISNPKKPVLDTSFFQKGCFLPDQLGYPNSSHGVFKIAFTQTTTPSLFFSSAHYITRVILGEQFSMQAIIPQTLSAILAFQKAHGKTVPFLTGIL